MAERIAHITTWLLAHRRAVLFIHFLFFLLAGLSAGQLQVDFSPKSFHAEDSTERKAFENYAKRWHGDVDAAFVVVERAQGGEWTPEQRSLVDALRLELRQLPEVARVRAADPGPAPHSRTPKLVSEDGRYALLLLSLAEDLDDVDALQRGAQSIRRSLSAYEAKADLKLHLGGMPILRADATSVGLRDLLRLFPIAMLGMAGILALLFRRLYGLVVPMVAALSPVVFLAGSMSLANEAISLLNQVYFTLIPALALADSIHLLLAVQDHARSEDPERLASESASKAILVRAASEVGPACIWTSLTSILAFSALIFTPEGGLARFGLFAALGLFFALLIHLSLTPLLLSFVDPRHFVDSRSRRFLGPLERSVESFTRRVIEHRRLVLFLGSISFLPLLYLAAPATLDDHSGELLSSEHPTSRAQTLIDRELLGTIQVGIQLDPSTTETIRWRDTLEAGLPALRASLESIPEVRGTMLQFDTQGARVLVFTRDTGSRGYGVLRTRLEAVIARHLDERTTRATLLGRAQLAYPMIDRILHRLAWSVLPILGAIALSLAVVFRQLGLALVLTLVNAWPLLISIAAVGVVDTRFDVATAVLLCITVGFVVDDTLHFIARFLQLLGHGHDLHAAISLAAKRCGSAVVISSGLLIFAFLTHLPSSFVGTARMAWLGALIVAAALVADLLFLPASLALLPKQRSSKAHS